MTASLDKLVLFSMGNATGDLVYILHDSGCLVLVFTIDDETEWSILESVGADGMYVNDITMGLMMEMQ